MSGRVNMERLSSQLYFREVDMTPGRRGTILADYTLEAKNFPNREAFVNTALGYFGRWSVQSMNSEGYQRDLQLVYAFFASRVTTSLNFKVVGREDRLYSVGKSGDIEAFEIPQELIPTQLCPDSRAEIEVVTHDELFGESHKVNLRDPMVIAALNCKSFDSIVDIIPPAEGAPGGNGTMRMFKV